MDHNKINNSGTDWGTTRPFFIGFFLSLVLTAIAFALVMSSILSPAAVLFCITAAAILQIFVHLRYFLHLNFSSDMRLNVMALVFTLLIMILFIGGTLWILFNLNYRMM